MADNDLSVNTVKVGELGVTDHVEGSDKFLMSRPGDGEESDVTYTAEANGIYAGAAESDPVVNKIYEIAKEPATRTIVGAVKPGIGLDVRTDGTLDNKGINKNLLFCGDDLTVGLLYDESTGTYYYPNGLELPIGMFYTIPTAGRTSSTSIQNAWNYLRLINVPDTIQTGYSYSENSKIGKLQHFPAEMNNAGLSNIDNMYIKPDTKLVEGNDDSFTPIELGDYSPLETKKIQHLIEWTPNGLHLGYSDSSFTVFETIMLNRVSSRRSVDRPVLDVDHRSFTVTFKLATSWQSQTDASFKYFTCSFDATTDQTEAILVATDDSTQKLGKLIITGDISRSYDKDYISGKHTGVIHANISQLLRGLYWKIGRTTNDELQDYDCTYDAFKNGIAYIVSIKVEYGTQFTGFENDFINFSSKESTLNQGIEYASKNAVHQVAKENVDVEDSMLTSGKFPDVIFHKNKPPITFKQDLGVVVEEPATGELREKIRNTGANPDYYAVHAPGYYEYREEQSKNFIDKNNFHTLVTNIPGFIERGAGFRESDFTQDPETGIHYIVRPVQGAPVKTPVRPGEEVRGQAAIGTIDNYVKRTLPPGESVPAYYPNKSDITNTIFDESKSGFPSQYDDSWQTRLKMSNMLKIADQYFSGQVTINGEEFSLKERTVKISNGNYNMDYVAYIDEEDPTEPHIQEYKWRCTKAPTYSVIRDMLCLNPATPSWIDTVHPSLDGGYGIEPPTRGHLGGVMIGDGLNVNHEGDVSLKPATSSSIGGIKVGSGLVIDENGILSATGGGGGGGASSLSELSDTDISNPTEGQCLRYRWISGSPRWINENVDVPTVLSDLDNVAVAGAQDGEFLRFSSVDNRWHSQNGAFWLNDLTDVTTVGRSNGDVLVYNSSTQNWEPNSNYMPMYEVTGTLSAGSTSITLNEDHISNSSTIDVYTSAIGVNPTNYTIGTKSITLVFEAQSSNIDVKVRVS